MKIVKKSTKSKDVNVTISVDREEWELWCRKTEKLGFTGKEYLTLLFLYSNECEVDFEWFEELYNPPEWAKERLLKGLLKDHNCNGNCDYCMDFRKRLEPQKEAA